MIWFLTGIDRLLRVVDQTLPIFNEIQVVLVHLVLTAWPKLLIKLLGIEKSEYDPYRMNNSEKFVFTFKASLTMSNQITHLFCSVSNSPFWPISTVQDGNWAFLTFLHQFEITWRYPAAVEAIIVFDTDSTSWVFYKIKIFWL